MSPQRNRSHTSANTESWASTFLYDGKLRLRLSRDYEWRNGGWVQTNEVRRVYDGMLVIQERDQLNVPNISYTRGLDLSGSREGAGGIGGLLAVSDHKLPILDHCYFHCDANGNVTALVDANQNVVARYLYDPFGNTLMASGPKAGVNRYRFSSKPIHELSGMYDYLYRWYIPDLQRWPNRDPIEERGGVNLYGFVGNDPANAVDAFGEQIVNTNPPFGGGPTASDPRSIGGIMGGNQADAHGSKARNPCSPIGATTPPKPKGTKTIKCPCTSCTHPMDVVCYEWKECVLWSFGWAGKPQGTWVTKTDCK